MKSQVITTNSFEETQKFGEELSQHFSGGEIVLLHGDLGSGKTTLTQGIAKGLGITKKVVSPTFLIMRRYAIENNPISMLYHIDAYRLKDALDAEGLGLGEIFADTNGVVVCEWPERIQSILPKRRMNIYCDYIDENSRRFTIEEHT